jgi:hypothetical protein
MRASTTGKVKNKNKANHSSEMERFVLKNLIKGRRQIGMTFRR